MMDLEIGSQLACMSHQGKYQLLNICLMRLCALERTPYVVNGPRTIRSIYHKHDTNGLIQHYEIKLYHLPQLQLREKWWRSQVSLKALLHSVRCDPSLNPNH